MQRMLVILFLILNTNTVCFGQDVVPVAEKLLLQRGHNFTVHALSISNDDRYLLSGGVEGDVILWDIRRGIELQRFSGHKFYIHDIRFCSGDSVFLVEDANGFVYKWNISKQQIVQTLATSCGGHDVEISPDGAYVSAVRKDTLRLYETTNFNLVRTFPNVNRISFAKDVFLIQGDTSMSVVTYKDLEKLYQSKGKSKIREKFNLSPDGKFIVTTDTYNTLSFIKVGDSSWRREPIKSVRRFYFSQDGKLLVTHEEARNKLEQRYSIIGIHNLATETKHRIVPAQLPLQSFCISSSSKLVATVSIIGQPYDPIRIWDTKTGRLLSELRSGQAEISRFAYDKKMGHLYTARNSSTFQKWDMKGEGVLWSSDHLVDGIIHCLELTSTGDKIALSHSNTVELYSTSDGRFLKYFWAEELGLSTINQLKFWPDDRHILTGNSKGIINLWSIEQRKKIFSGNCGLDIQNITVISDTEILLSGHNSHFGTTVIKLAWNSIKHAFERKSEPPIYSSVLAGTRSGGEVLFSLEGDNEVVKPMLAICDLDGKKKSVITGFKNFIRTFDVAGDLLVAGDDSGWVYTVNLKEQKILAQQRYSAHRINEVRFLDDQKKVLAVHSVVDRGITLFSFPSFKQYLTIMDNPNGWLLLNPKGYYFGSKNIDDFVYFKNRGRIYSFDQFDLEYNRPDVVLQELPGVNKDVLSLYKDAYLKRVRKQSVEVNTPNMNKPVVFEPQFGIQVTDSLTSKNELELRITASDSLYAFKNLIIYVNGVPEPMNKTTLHESKKLDTLVRVPLSKGDNKIEVSLKSTNGSESYKERIFTTFYRDTSVKKNLFVLTYGVSNFIQTSYNLVYPSKDARDIAEFFKLPNKYYNNVFISTLVNEDCTRQKLVEALQAIGRSAGVNDNVVIFFGTHGMTLDNELFLATYDMDFANPKSNGINFNLVDSLMYFIKSRQKTIWIDACQSGELDKDDIPMLQKKVSMPGLVLRSAGPPVTGNKKEQLAFLLMKDQFASLERQSGTTVLAASSGIDAAVESDAWQNGLFTYAILSGLKKQAADLNKDEGISIGELKKYTERKVMELSQGLQRASTRNENPITDFRLY